MPGRYLDGTLIRGGDSQVYVIVNGQRCLATNFSSLESGPESGTIDMVPQLSAEELNAIPEGPALEVAIQADRQDEVASDMPRRLMETRATLSQESMRIDAWTHTWTRQPWFGFTGGVLVLFSNANGEYVGNTDLHQFGVDGFRIPFKRWNREDWWSEVIAESVSQQSARLEIVHSHAPRERLLQALNDIRNTTNIIGQIVTQVRAVTG